MTSSARPGLLFLLALASAAAGCGEPAVTLSRPNALCVRADGTVAVSDFHHQRVVVFDPTDGRTVAVLGEQGLEPGELWQPWSVACAEGAAVVVNARVRSADDHEEIWEVQRLGWDGGGSVAPLVRPEGEAVGWIGGLVPDTGGGWLGIDEANGVIVRYGADFEPLEQWTRPDGGPPFEGPSYVAARGDDLWLVEQYVSKIRRLTPDGRKQELRFGVEGREPGQLLFPKAVGACPGEWIVVADMGNYRLQRFTLDGTYLDGFEPAWRDADSPLQLMDVAVSPDCSHLYIVDSKGDRVLVLTPTGEVVRELTAVSP